MQPDPWGALTPEEVAKHVSFDTSQPDWSYKPEDRSMATLQAEGVAGLWNRLSIHGAALLADEVGTGKTLQALGVMALLWQMQPDAKVLVMAPNRDICRHWAREYSKFVRSHYRHTDNLVRMAAGESMVPVHGARIVKGLHDLEFEVSKGDCNFFISTIHSLSGLARDHQDEWGEKIGVVRREARRIHRSLMRSLSGRGFDLLVLDEAHYFRNRDGGTQRAHASLEFFGTTGDRLAQRSLLLTATPSHAAMDDVKAMLSYVMDVGDESPADLLKKLALRRLRRMAGRDRDTLHERAFQKSAYRHEQARPATFANGSSAELFFALYQKKLVQIQADSGRRFLYGYLEGFESAPKTGLQPDQVEDDATEKRDYHHAPDTQVLSDLAKAFELLGGPPDHPKYDKQVEICTPRDVFDAGQALHENKHLVFVRRIPSVREITRRINRAYDRQLARRILGALAAESAHGLEDEWEKHNWSRDFFNSRIAPLSDTTFSDGRDDEFDTPREDNTADDDMDDSVVGSQIANLFVVKKAGSDRSTHCSNFRLRLRNSDSILSLLLEPALDFKQDCYRHYTRRQSGSRWRDEYASIARESRQPDSPVHDQELENFDTPMPTLWGKMYAHLTKRERCLLNRLVEQKRVESFAEYVKHGFVFASPVMVELFCWHVEFSRRCSTGHAHPRYLEFIDFIEKRLERSLALAYFRSALASFETLSNDFVDADRGQDWNVLSRLHSPAAFASGEVSDRHRLILGFNTPFFPNVLVATSVLQEGVNLHLQCTKVHHYGIAWTPGDNEQRVGRVDRLFGKVNEQLAKKGAADLGIYYPYLERSLDEEQLAAFVERKYYVESMMDRCQLEKEDSGIDLRHSHREWSQYLRTPAEDADSQTADDPYPFRDTDKKPPGEYRPADSGRDN